VVLSSSSEKNLTQPLLYPFPIEFAVRLGHAPRWCQRWPSPAAVLSSSARLRVLSGFVVFPNSFVAFFGLFGLILLAFCRVLWYNGVNLLVWRLQVSPYSLCSTRSVAFSAFRSGGLVSVALRPARWSPSVLVLVAGFRSQVGAGLFARRWSARLGRPVVVRRSGRFRSVSVPVAGIPSGLCFGVWVRGGLRGLVRALSVLASGHGVRLGVPRG